MIVGHIVLVMILRERLSFIGDVCMSCEELTICVYRYDIYRLSRSVRWTFALPTS